MEGTSVKNMGDIFWVGGNSAQERLLCRLKGERRGGRSKLAGRQGGRAQPEGQFSVAVVSGKEQFQAMSRSRVKLWGWTLEGVKAKEPNSQWLDGPQRKTMRQMPKSTTEG